MMQKEANSFSDSNLNKKKNMWPAAFAALALAFIVSSSAGGYFYWQNIQLKKNPQQIVQKEIQELVAKVSKLIVLPGEENPTVFTVADLEKLKDQPFFSKAKKGDKVLIYTNAKKAILYDPVNNKIVEVAPVNIGNTAANSNNTAEQK